MKDPNRRSVAIKISKNKKFDVNNAQIELRFIKRLTSKDESEEDLHVALGKDRIIECIDSFNFRQHFFIVLENLNISLYRFMQINLEKKPLMEPKLLRRVIF